MKFPRNARVFRGNLEIVPYVSVFFILVVFVLLGPLAYTPGVHMSLREAEDSTGAGGRPIQLSLPEAEDLPGVEGPRITVAVDSAGRLFFKNQIIEESELKSQLRAAERQTTEKITLIIQADKAVTYDNLMNLTMLARDVRIRDIQWATLPRAVTGTPSQPGDE